MALKPLPGVLPAIRAANSPMIPCAIDLAALPSLDVGCQLCSCSNAFLENRRANSCRSSIFFLSKILSN